MTRAEIEADLVDSRNGILGLIDYFELHGGRLVGS